MDGRLFFGGPGLRRRGLRAFGLALPDPRVMPERFEPIVARERVERRVGRREQVLGAAERPRRGHPIDPRGGAAAIGERAARFVLVHRVELHQRRVTAAGHGRHAEHAQAAHAAVRKNVDSHVRGDRGGRQFTLEHVHVVRFQFRPLEDPDPLGDGDGGIRRHAPLGLVDDGGFDRAALGVVALEVSGVDLDAADLPLGAETDNRPVVAGTAAAARLPPVAHVRRAIRHQHVARLAEEAIAAVDDVGAVRDGGEIDLRAAREERAPVGNRLAEHPQPRNAAIGINIETQMRVAPAIVDREGVLRVAAQLGTIEHGAPDRRIRGQLRFVRPAGRDARVDRAVRWIVSPKERRVHDDRPDDPGEAEPDERPVVPRRAPPARFPAVHPFAAIRVLVGDEDRRLGLQQVLLRCEEIIVRGDDNAAEPG